MTTGCYVAGFSLTLIIAISLLFIESQLSVKPLMRKLNRIRCRKKFRFVLKMLNSDRDAWIPDASTAFRYYNTQASQTISNFLSFIVWKALKKHLELNKKKEFIIHKPSSLKKYVFSSGLALTKLRKRRNGNLPACLLVERVTLSKIGIRKFSSTTNLIEYRELNSKILDMISNNYWPTNNKIIKNSINNWVKSNQQKINVSDPQQQLELVSTLTFDIKNRIYSIDKVFNNGKCSNYNQVVIVI